MRAHDVVARVALAAALVINVAAYPLDLYRRFWWFDEAIHGYTSAALTLWSGLLLSGTVVASHTGRRPLGVLLVALIVAAVGVAIGALWEIGEWAYDLVVPRDAIKGQRDTIIDLIMDSVGASVAGAWAALAARGRRDPANGEG